MGTRYRLGVDVGGTFTDLVAIDEDGTMTIAKSPSTPADSSIGAVNAIEKAGLDLLDATIFVHGATVGANTIIENKGAKTAIITTRGFRDNLELRRGRRVQEDPTVMYDLQMDLPQDYVGGHSPLVSRKHRYEVTERMNYKGDVLTPLDEEELREIARRIGDTDVKAIAVCYLFSFLNPSHELRTAEILRELLPGVTVSLSSEILPIIREYERLSTTTLNAYIMPIMQMYIENLRRKLAARGFTRDFYIMQSSGGIMSSRLAGERPVYTIDSGPAGGVSASADLGKALGYPNVIAFDMGGTTTKLCVVLDGTPAVTTEFWADGKYFSGAPIMNMVEIGAGGGSLCWIDSIGSVHVGPESAGADPGPAMYGLGGTRPTITDALMVLGYLNPDYFLGGSMKVSREASVKAYDEHLACKLGISVAEAANGVYRIANANMTGAMRIVTIQRGHDPRDFSMVVSGGTGALHAVRLCQELHIPRVIVPPAAGVFSAVGLVTADAVYDVYRSYVVRSTNADPQTMQSIFDEMTGEALHQIVELGFRRGQIEVRRKVSMRYEGQAHEVTVDIPAPLASRALTKRGLAEIERLFHEKHKVLFGHSSPEAPCEFFTMSVSAVGPMKKAPMASIERAGENPDGAYKADRHAYFTEFGDYVPTPTYERSLLKAGNIIVGPAIIEQMDTTTVIPPEQVAEVDQYGNIVIDVTVPRERGA